MRVTQLHMVSVESCHLACPAPTSSDGQTGSGSLLACVCDPGYRAARSHDAGAWVCSECGPGRFQPSRNASACLQCPTGTYSAAATAVSGATCLRCAPCSFADTKASSVCRVCLANTWQDERAADAVSRACEPCPSNSRGVVTGAVSVATCVCNVGFRFADGSVLPDGSPDADAYGCALCDASSFCPGSGVSTTCPTNHWSYAGVNAGPCAQCAPRSYALQEAGMRGPELCQCVQGAQGISDSGCALCAPGSFQPCDFSLRRNHTGTQCAGQLSGLGVLASAYPVACAPCEADTYSDAHGAVACTACPGNSSSGPGSIDRTGCR